MSLYAYMILFISFLVMVNTPQDIFTIRIIETVAVSILTATLLDFLIVYTKERKFRFPGGALISGLIIAALVEPELDNRAIYLVPPAFAIISKQVLRIKNRNIFNPAAFGLTAVRLFSHDGIVTWWAARPLFLVVPLGLFIVFKMRGWHLVVSFVVTSIPLYVLYGLRHQINMLDSLGFINFFFVLFMLTEHKSAPTAHKARIAYGCFIAVLSFLLFVFFPGVENSLTALLVGNACVPIVEMLRNKKSFAMHAGAA